MATILVCDDDKDIVEAISIYLEQEGHQILKAYDGQQALLVLQKNEVDLLIIDVMMPKLDGIRATLKIREYSSIPIIILSAKSEDTDKILGLNIGADDYITKPFGMMEFVARVKAVLRRCARQNEERELHCKGLRVNVARHEVSYQGELKELTRKEFELLEYLLENKGLVMSRNQILCHIWGYDFDGETRTVDVHVRTLRQKLGEAGNLIETVRGVGYRIGDHL